MVRLLFWRSEEYWILLHCYNFVVVPIRISSMCYIIKEWFFDFDHFSLIIFYHSVWLGFELFGLRVQVCSQLVQFTLAHKGYDNHHCHKKLQTGNEAGVWMTSCPEEIGWEFGRFWKRFSWVQTMVLRSWVPTMMLRSWVRPWCWEDGVRPWSWRLTLDHGSRQLSFLPFAAAVKFFGSRLAKMNWDLKHHEMCRTWWGLLT